MKKRWEKVQRSYVPVEYEVIFLLLDYLPRINEKHPYQYVGDFSFPREFSHLEVFLKEVSKTFFQLNYIDKGFIFFD